MHLRRDEALSNLMLGIVLSLEAGSSHYDDVTLVTVHDDRGRLLAGLRTAPANLILYAAARIPLDESLQCLADGFLREGVSLPGAIGPKEVAERFAAIWSSLTDCRVELEMPLRVYELRTVNSEVIGEGRLRLAQEADLEWIVSGTVGFLVDGGLDNAPDLEGVRRAARRQVERQDLYLWEHEGEIVSMAATTRATGRGIALNQVYTPKELRGRGYATSCVASLGQHLLDSGYEFCTLFADLKNPTSNGVYLRVGFEPIGDFAAYRFLGGTA